MKRKQNYGAGLVAMNGSRWLFVGLFLMVVAAVSWGIWSRSFIIDQHPVVTKEWKENPKTPTERLFIGEAVLEVEVRRTESEHALGLSWRETMGKDEGMAFVYQEPYRGLFWMKGMQFPLDFIWVRNGQVIQLSEQISHPTEAEPIIETVAPVSEVDLVVEMNAGWVTANGIRVGDVVEWENSR
jgi:uncharacterized membrane protein (UPF0127 family)